MEGLYLVNIGVILTTLSTITVHWPSPWPVCLSLGCSDTAVLGEDKESVVRRRVQQTVHSIAHTTTSLMIDILTLILNIVSLTPTSHPGCLNDVLFRWPNILKEYLAFVYYDWLVFTARICLLDSDCPSKVPWYQTIAKNECLCGVKTVVLYCWHIRFSIHHFSYVHLCWLSQFIVM